jgi:2TM domain-containing protein
MTNLIHDRPTDIDTSTPAGSEEHARQQAIKQIERRRRFKVSTAVAAVGMALLVVIWAMSEYHNAGGWPTHGFSQSSGIHDVWNFWIVYPLGAWVFITAAAGWSVYLRKPISEGEIKREIERQADTSR